MAEIDNLARYIRMNKLFAPDTPIEGGYDKPTYVQPGSTITPGDEVRGIDNRLGSITMGRNAAMGSNPYDDSDIGKLMNTLYSPEHRYSDLYEQELNKMPQRTKPSTGRKIVATLAGMGGGVKAADQVLDAPYNEALGDWEAKMKYLSPGMTYERYANSNERSNAYQTAQAILRERGLQQSALKNQQIYETQQKKLALQSMVAQGWKLKTSDDGYIYRIASVPGSQPENTGVRSDELSDYEKIQMRIDAADALEDKRQGNRLELEHAQAADRTDLTNLRADIQGQLQQMRYDLMGQNRWSNPVQAFDKDGKPLPYALSINGVTGEAKKIDLNDARMRVIPPGSGGSGNVQTETQKAAGISNRARQVKAENTDWGKYIKFDKSGRFTQITRPGYLFGPDQQTYEKIYEKIYQEPFTAQPAETLKNQGNAATPKVGDVKTFPNGKKGKWDGRGWALIQDTGATK